MSHEDYTPKVTAAQSRDTLNGQPANDHLNTSTPLAAVQPSMLDRALALAKCGIHVHPLCWADATGACGCHHKWDRSLKRYVDHEGKEIGKAPVTKGGYKSATLEPATIDEWWTRWPTANIGIALEASKLFVIDQDGPEAREEALAKGLRGGLDVQTGKGYHTYFHCPKGGPTVRKIGTGTSGKLDVLSDGYVIGPGSVHRNGTVYTPDRALDVAVMSEPPEWALDTANEPEPEPKPRAASSVRPTATPPDDDLLQIAFRAENGKQIRALYNGDISGYGDDESRAEMALCGYLAFYSGDDPARLDRWFRASGLMRDKWDRSATKTHQTYGQVTVEKAIASQPKFYTPPTRPQISKTVDHWPEPPDEKALYYGLPGAMVKVIEKYTEGDPAAVLMQLLVAYGNQIGPDIYTMVGAERHALHEFLALVGKTGSARKGNSFQPVAHLFSQVDSTWTKRRRSGFGSGEGLIQYVRDPNEKDDGVSDKRLLAMLPELAHVFAVNARQGNTLSETFRQAWDSGDLQITTRGSSVTATRPHISLIGHITAEDLRKNLTATEIANGFANRILWLAVRRSKRLDDPPIFEGPEVDKLVLALCRALERAKALAGICIQRDADAKVLWKKVYNELADLADEGEGILHELTARADIHIVRLSSIYAVFDGSPVVQIPHLVAAIELWAFVERSLQHIYGSAPRIDPDEETIWRRLQQCPASRNQLIDLFNRNRSAAQIEAVMERFEGRGLVRWEMVETGGRAAKVWSAVPGEDLFSFFSLSRYTRQPYLQTAREALAEHYQHNQHVSESIDRILSNDNYTNIPLHVYSNELPVFAVFGEEDPHGQPWEDWLLELEAEFAASHALRDNEINEISQSQEESVPPSPNGQLTLPAPPSVIQAHPHTKLRAC